MIKAIKNTYTQIIWRISRKIFLGIRNDSNPLGIDTSEANTLNYFLKKHDRKNKILLM